MNKQIYHYDPIDLFYIGSQTIHGYEEGRGMIPYAATEIAPPPRNLWPRDHIPIFCQEKEAWFLEKNEFWTVEMTERCFYTGRNSLGPAYIVNSRQNSEYSNELLKYANTFSFGSIPRIGPVSGVLQIGQRIDFINFCIEQIETNWIRIKTTPSSPVFGGEANLHHFFSESLVSSIRRLLDDVTTALFLKFFKKYDPWTKNLVIDGYSSLLGKNPEQRVDKVIPPSDKGKSDSNKLRDEFIEIILGKNKIFLEMIQGMNNAYKHSITASITRQHYGGDFPTVLTVGTADHPPHCNLGKLVFYNHSLRQVVMGLDDYLSDLTNRIAGSNPHFPSEERCEAHRISSSTEIFNGPASK